jgi:hypothetical protein
VSRLAIEVNQRNRGEKARRRKRGREGKKEENRKK